MDRLSGNAVLVSSTASIASELGLLGLTEWFPAGLRDGVLLVVDPGSNNWPLKPALRSGHYGSILIFLYLYMSEATRIDFASVYFTPPLSSLFTLNSLSLLCSPFALCSLLFAVLLFYCFAFFPSLLSFPLFSQI